MPYKDPIKQKAAQAKHYQDNKENYRQSDKNAKAKKMKRWLEYKSTLVCSRCGESRFPCLEFHHPTAREGKEPSISYLVRRVGWDKLMKAIEECEVLCANCHKIEHWNGSNYLPSPNDGITKKPDSFNSLSRYKRR